MTVYFSNRGAIDLDTVRTMGVHVKATDNPIGYFGTGLKYAIATLLRTGHRVVLILEGKNIEFFAKPKTIRGQEFQLVFMEDEQLAFTTDLGRNWEVWQAYRELHSNCIDEMGTIKRMPVEGSDTIWAITGEGIEAAFADRAKTFLHSEPQWMAADGLEVHRGRSKFLYYRGVRVYELPKEAMFTYNFLMPMRLTEDRSLASLHDAMYKIGTRVPTIADPEFATKILNPKVEKWEDTVDLSDAYQPSEEFLDALQRYGDDIKSDSVRRMVKKHRPEKSTREAVELSAAQEAMIEDATELLKHLKIYLQEGEVTYVSNLGQDIHGLVEDGKIYISLACVNKGADWIASTLYEEWIHLHLGYTDKSQGLQQFLFDKVLELTKELSLK